MTEPRAHWVPVDRWNWIATQAVCGKRNPRRYAKDPLWVECEKCRRAIMAEWGEEYGKVCSDGSKVPESEQKYISRAHEASSDGSPLGGSTNSD